MGNFTRFAPPVIANGKVYVPAHSNAVQVYGRWETDPLRVQRCVRISLPDIIASTGEAPMMRLVLISIVSATGVLAQVSSGTLTGIVTDPSQARLPNVALKLTNEATGVSLPAATNTQGEYTYPLLDSGRYRLEVETSGFQKFTRTGIVMELGRVVRLDIALQIGQVTESVEVTGAPPMLESESATIGQFIENKSIADMPLNGRRVGQMLALLGTGVYIQGDIIRPRVSVAGGRADQQQWMLDGVNSSNIALEGPQALFNPPVEAVQEIRVHQNAYSAEFGNSSGGVVTMTTRSGSNKLAGVLYEYLRNDRLNARDYFAATKPPLRWNAFGGAVGGPVIKNRTFFFANVEFQRQRIGVVRLWTVPTELQRRGDFSGTRTAAGALQTIYDPATSRPNPANPAQTVRTPFAGNLIPPSRFDPVGAKIVPVWPLPNQPPSNLAGANNFNRNATNALNLSTGTTKVDHIFSETDRISGRVVVHDFPTNNTPAFDEIAGDPNANDTRRRAFSYMVNEVHSFSPSIWNDCRFNWQPRRFHPISLSFGQNWPSKLGLKGVNEHSFPRINAAAYVSMGLTQQERIQIPIHDADIIDVLSVYRGKHSHRFGGEIRLSRNVDDLNSLISGQFTFGLQPTAQPGVANTGNSVASLLLGFPNAADVLDSDILDRRAKYFALFWQDDWKATANLTINLGFRWEAHTPRFDQNDRQNSFNDTLINPVSRTPGVITFAGRDGEGRQVYNGDWNNFMPRIGLAWKPFGWQRTVVRAGYGVFFGPPLPGSNNMSAGFAVASDFATPDNGITAPFFLRDGLPGGTSRPKLDPGFGAVPVGQAAVFSPQFIERNRRLGYSQQWNLSIQRDMRWNTILELSYAGNVGRKLNGPSTSVNQVPENLMGPGNAQARRPFPQFGNVVSISPFWGNSSYHAVNVKIEKRFSNGMNFLGNYTFSKFIDDVAAGFEIGQVGGGIQNYYDRRAEKALSGNDVRNRFVWSAVYELPWGKGRKWMPSGVAAALLGGWNLGGILTFQQGSPMGLVTQVNTTNAFASGAQRVNVLRDPTLPKSERTTGRWFDTSAVVAPPQFTFGNAGRALLAGPGLANVDLSLLKNFPFSERYNIQFRLETFNTFNRANFQEPGRALGSPQFGVISDANEARSIQLGLKLTF